MREVIPDTAAAPQSRWRGALRCTPVRLVLLFALLAAVDIGCQLLGALVVHQTPMPGVLRGLTRVGAAGILSAVMVGSYRWLVRATEQRTPQELGRRGSVKALAAGTAGGAALFGFVYALLWVLGAAQLQGFGGYSGLAGALAVAIASAVGEEVVFRGVVFRLLEERLGTTLALLLSASAFGAVHAANNGATWVSTLAIALESGVLLGVAYAATRTLWLPIGLHFGWNFTEGGIFGAAVSGGHSTGLLVAPLSGPPLITGGTFGPEASLVAVAVSLAASAALAGLALHRGLWRSRQWPGHSARAL